MFSHCGPKPRGHLYLIMVPANRGISLHIRLKVNTSPPKCHPIARTETWTENLAPLDRKLFLDGPMIGPKTFPRWTENFSPMDRKLFLDGPMMDRNLFLRAFGMRTENVDRKLF